MNARSNHGGLDVFRFAAAFLVVAIHTSVVTSFNAEADFFFTRILARLAVPFFFMVTGQFILSEILVKKTGGFSAVRNYLKRILLLYVCCVLFYLPLGIYAGHYEKLTPLSALRLLLFDGPFYHLWYFPALILGILLLCLLRRFCSFRVTAVLSAVLYLIGLLGDSYWGFTAQIPGVSSAYEWGFLISSYTRNGLFLAPLFLLMGAWFGQERSAEAPMKNGAALAVSFSLMTAEGFLLRHFSLQRHDSMYLMLPVCMFFLYRLLLSWQKKPNKLLRAMSTLIYILHPAVIVAVRGIAKPLHAMWLLVDNSLVHFITVSLVTAAVSLLLLRLLSFLKQKPFERGRAWIELDRSALRHNAALLRSLLPKSCELMPAVKANAYGHGAVPVAKALKQMGVSAFCVACVSEGIELRKSGVGGEILILGYTHPKDFPLLRRYRLTQTIVDDEYALMMKRYGKKLHVHLGIDTGMHRLGVGAEDIERLCGIFQIKNVKVEGAFTHLCTDDADTPSDKAFVKKQAQVFFEVIDALNHRGCYPKKVHLLSSCGVLNYPELCGDYARIGIALYGVRSDRLDYDASKAGLRPVLSLKARVASVRQLEPHEGAGYGLAFTARRPTRLAALCIGYADGLPRSLSCENGAVLIRGERAPIVGRVCMDQTLVDVTDIPGVQGGDVAVVIGRMGKEEISVYDIAESAGTITNEILSGLGARLKRIIL